MRTDTLFQLCFYFCACLLVFSLSVSFVVVSGFYNSGIGSELSTNLNASTDTNDTFSDITQQNLDESDAAIRSHFSFGSI